MLNDYLTEEVNGGLSLEFSKQLSGADILDNGLTQKHSGVLTDLESSQQIGCGLSLEFTQQ
ncbi:unnamed protein product, partial [marine sediment metagenome]